jgi:hypothetical protein
MVATFTLRAVVCNRLNVTLHPLPAAVHSNIASCADHGGKVLADRKRLTTEAARLPS